LWLGRVSRFQIPSFFPPPFFSPWVFKLAFLVPLFQVYRIDFHRSPYTLAFPPPPWSPPLFFGFFAPVGSFPPRCCCLASDTNSFPPAPHHPMGFSFYLQFPLPPLSSPVFSPTVFRFVLHFPSALPPPRLTCLSGPSPSLFPTQTSFLCLLLPSPPDNFPHNSNFSFEPVFFLMLVTRSPHSTTPTSPPSPTFFPPPLHPHLDQIKDQDPSVFPSPNTSSPLPGQVSCEATQD